MNKKNIAISNCVTQLKCRLYYTQYTNFVYHIYMPRKNWKDINTMLMLENGRKVKSLSRVRLFATPWTVAYQASPSMGFSRQEYWSGLPFPSPGDLPDPGIEPGSLALEADTLTSEPPGKPMLMAVLSYLA